MKYTDPNGKWSVEISYWRGIGGKVKFGKNNGRWEFIWRFGFGIGGGVQIDFKDESFVDEVSSGAYAGGEVSFSNDMLSGELSTEVGVTLDGTQEDIRIDNKASLSITTALKETASIEVDNGETEISPIELDLSVSPGAKKGVAADLYIGFGGQGYIE